MDFQQKLNALVEKYHLPALGVAIMNDGTESLFVAGQRKAGDVAPVLKNDKFHMGSCGKAVTAALVHQLVAEGHFHLDNKISELLPDIKIDPAYQNITLSQLLTHMSGLPSNYEDMEKIHALGASEDPAAIRLKMMQEILGTKPEVPVEKAYAYSNLGYILLGLIAEHATGHSYEKLVQTRIFDKLGMKDAGFGCAQSHNAVTADQPWGHLHDEDSHALQPVWLDNPTAYAPAGTIHAPLSDWIKFLQHIAQKKDGYGTSEATIDDSDAKYTDAGLIRLQGIYSHDGSNGLNYARVLLLPKLNTVVVIACNDGSSFAGQAVEELTADIIHYCVEPFLKKQPPSPPPQRQ